jgi:hypothetical protein
MDCFKTKVLYVILPYFNFCNFKRRRELFINFVNENSKNSKLKIIVVELIGKTPLGNLNVWKHLKFRMDGQLWIKENLINKGVAVLPKDWRYMAWIDADIKFLNEHWIDDTIYELKKSDIVQLWRSAINLGPFGETIKVDKSFGYMANGSGTEWTPTDKYGNWHPGYAWACTRRFFNRTGGLIDWAILGSADRHMAMAMIGKALESGPSKMHANYRDMLEEFQNRVKGLSLGWINGTIVHNWHGTLENRKYKERWNILIHNKYDPFLDIGVNDEGIIQLTSRGKRLEAEIKTYFLARSEDS